MVNTAKKIALGAVVALALTGCGGGGGGGGNNGGEAPGTDIDYSAEPTGTLRTMGFNPSDEVGSSRSDLAAEQLGDVTVEMDTANFDAQKFAALQAAGNVPDVVQMDRHSIPTYAQKNLILPLDACFEAQGVDPGEYWYPAVADEASWDGAIYGAPQFFQPSIVIVNTRVADAAGVAVKDIDTSNPDGLVQAAEKMTTMSGAQPTTLGFDPDMPGSATLWIEVFGGQIMDEQGQPTLDDPKNVEALEFMNRLMDAQGGYTEVASFKQTWDVFGDANQYVEDQIGAATWAQWYINVLTNTRDGVELAATPVKDLDGNPFALAGGSALAIPSGAKNPVAACKWITAVTSLEAWETAGDARAQTVQDNDGINTGLFTGSPSADEAIRQAHVVETGTDFDGLIQTSYDILSDVRTPGTSPVGQPIRDALNNAVGVALSGEQSPADALAQAQQTAMREWEALG